MIVLAPRPHAPSVFRSRGYLQPSARTLACPATARWPEGVLTHSLLMNATPVEELTGVQTSLVRSHDPRNPHLHQNRVDCVSQSGSNATFMFETLDFPQSLSAKVHQEKDAENRSQPPRGEGQPHLGTEKKKKKKKKKNRKETTRSLLADAVLPKSEPSNSTASKFLRRCIALRGAEKCSLGTAKPLDDNAKPSETQQTKNTNTGNNQPPPRESTHELPTRPPCPVNYQLG